MVNFSCVFAYPVSTVCALNIILYWPTVFLATAMLIINFCVILLQ